ncbi:MAG: F0F1 ATP synthase subunit delta [Patescibacteria group bacterium]
MYKDISAKVRTTQEVTRLEEEVDLLLASVYKVDKGTFEEVLDRQVRVWIAQAIKEKMAKEGIGKEEFLRDLKEKIGKIKVLRVTLAFELTEASLDRLHNWVAANVEGSTVFEISYNPTLLAGAIVTYEGRYKDYSLRKKFSGYFETNGKKLMKMLEN